MKEDSENVYYDDDDVLDLDLKKYFQILLTHWKAIAICSFAASILGIVLSFGIPKEYKVVSKVAPELSLRSNSLTSLASVAGINMNMLSNTNDALLPTVYPEIIGSVPFVTELFEMPVKDSTLYQYMLNGRKHSWLGTVMSLPSMAVGAVVNLFKDEEESVGLDSVDVFHLTKEQYMVYKGIGKSIQVSVDKRSFLVTLTVIEQDPEVAANLSRAVIDNLKQYVIRYRTEKAQQTCDFLQVAYEDAKSDYHAAQRRYAMYSDSHQEVFSQKSQVEKQRLQNEVNLAYQQFASLANQYQQSQITLQQETPVFAEVTPPTVPVRKSKPRRSSMAMAFFILGFLGSCAKFVFFNKKQD